MRYYKILHGFEPEDYIPIDETELEKAIFAHLRGIKAAFSGGSISGERIIAIQPDYHRAMGWNMGYKLGPEDFEELTQKGIDRAHTHFLGEKKDKVTYLMQNNKENLIGQNVEIPELNGPRNKEIDTGLQGLADKFKV